MKRLLTAAALSLFAAQGAQAQELTDMASEFSFPLLQTVFDNMGYEAETRQLSNGKTTMQIRSPEGLLFYAEPQACDANGAACKGLVYFSFFQQEGGYDLEALNNFNQQYYFIKAQRMGQGDAFLSRYLIADYGVPLGNIAVNAAVFNTLASRFQSEDSGAGGLSASVDVSAPAAAAIQAGAKAITPAAGHDMSISGEMSDYNVNGDGE